VVRISLRAVDSDFTLRSAMKLGMPLPRSLLSAWLLFVWLPLGTAQDYRDDLGFFALRDELGAAMPTGAGIGVSQVEAALDEGGTIYLPDIAGYAAQGKTITAKSGAGTTSGHATTVGTFFYDLNLSLAPGVTMVDAYEANDWIGDGFLRTGTTSGPRAESRKVQNHSWIGTTNNGMQDFDVEILRRFDFAIQTSDFVAVVGLNNGFGNPVPPLLASAYNAIAVGLTNGGAGSGLTTIDGSGRIKPEIVANPFIMQTSFSTPTVGAAAAMLRQNAPANAQHSVTLKALLLAGATKHQFPTWSRTTTQPLDSRFGAGQVNVYNSYHALAAGQQAASTSVSVGRRGWDFSTTTAGSRLYFFDIPLGDTASGFSAVLSWHRIITDGTAGPLWGSPTSNVPNLSLKIYAASGFVVSTLVDQSVSPVDNVEHLYEPHLPPGRYALEVTGDQTGISYGLAWNSVPTVSVTASAADASEQGLVAGTFTFTRVGDTSNALVVHYTIAGSAFAGADYTALPATVTIPANQTTATLNVVPVADSAAEGDETVTLTLTSHFAYGFDAPGSAVVTIHDLPIDAWRFAHFTAAELANPAISGDLADFDGDGLTTVAEYGLDLDPKVASVTGLPTLGRDVNGHPTLTYTKVLSATDITYTVELTTNFNAWTAIPESAAAVPVVLQALSGPVTATSPYTLSAEPKQFLRLRIMRP
jgi:hypothetical protein